MATTSQTTQLQIITRDTGSSRATRRLRRAGQVPGVLYGRGERNLAFAVDARELRHALAAHGAVLELELDGQKQPAVLKDSHKHPVRGEILHLDLLRVDLDKPIEQTIPIELLGTEDAPGVKEGGVLEHVTREVMVQALPSEIPDRITLDVSRLVMNDTVTMSALDAPAGVTILDHSDETVVVTLTPPKLQLEPDEDIEAETERVGEQPASGGDQPDAADES